MRMNKVVAELVDENLVARVDRAARDDLAAMIGVAGIDLEILPQNFRRRVDREGLVIALDARESEEKEKLPRSHILDRVLLSRDDVDVVAAEDDEIDDLFEKVRRRRGRGLTDDAVERRLHRAGRDFEGLDEIGADADRDHDRDQDHFDVLAPDGVLMWRRVRGEERVEPLRFFMRRAVVARGHRGAHLVDLSAQLGDGGFAQAVAPVTNQLLRMTNEEVAVLDVARLEHAAKR